MLYSAVFANTPAPQLGARIVNIAIDSWVTWHLHGRCEYITDLRACNDTIAEIDGAEQRCLGVDMLNITIKNHLDQTVQLSIQDVRLAPNANLSLLSASQLMADWFQVALHHLAHLGTPCGATLPLHVARDLFFLTAGTTPTDPPSQTRHCEKENGRRNCANGEPRQTNQAGLVATSQAAHVAQASSHILTLSTEAAATKLMSRRLHIGVKAMTMCRLPTFTADAPPSLAKVLANPSTTTDATMRRLSHVENRYCESTTGRLVHMDICGPLPESKLGRFRYAMVLVDDSTRFEMGLALRTRGEAGAHIRGFIARFNSLAAHSHRAASPKWEPSSQTGPKISSPTPFSICLTRMG